MTIITKYKTIILITFFYLCSYQGSEGVKFLDGAELWVRHVIDFGLLICVAVSGIYGLKSFNEKWPLFVWLSVYTAVICLLTMLGVIDVVHRFNNLSFRDMVGYFKLFFTSPVPYGVMLYLQRLAGKASNSVTIEELPV